MPAGMNFDPLANVNSSYENSAVYMSNLDGDRYVDVFDLLLIFEAYRYEWE